MSIRTRLVFGLSMLLALVMVQTFIATSQVGRLATLSDEIVVRSMKRIEHVNDINIDLVQWRTLDLTLVLAEEPVVRQQNREAINQLVVNLRSTMNRYATLMQDPIRRADYEAFFTHIDLYQALHERLSTLVETGSRDEAQAFFADSQGPFNEMLFHIRRLRTEEFEAAREASQAAASTARRARFLFGLATGVVAVVELGLAWYIARSLTTGLNSLLAGTRRIAQGDLTQPVASSGRDEFGDLAAAFNAMMGSLRRSQEENVGLTKEALRLQEERIVLLRDHLSRVVKAQEEERRRVARELHDQTGQALTALQLGLARLEHGMPSQGLRERAEALRQLAVETMEEIRNLALDLRPSTLDELGLVPALRSYIRDFSRRVGLPIDFEVTGQERRLPPDMETAIFRVIQEGLTNVVKHANAAHARVSLELDESRATVSVQDNGRGFDVAQTLQAGERRSLGLFGIRERVDLFGGAVAIDSAPGQGTTLRISVPLAGAAAAQEGQEKGPGEEGHNGHHQDSPGG